VGSHGLKSYRDGGLHVGQVMMDDILVRYRVSMFAGRRFALIGTVASVVWYLCVLLFWALQPLTDSVPVGIDYTLTQPKFVSASVHCQGLFDSAPRDLSALPVLKLQPAGKPPLGFQREPCGIVHSQARIVFAIDTVAFAAVVVCFVWLALRRRRASLPTRLGTSSPLAGSLTS
jgi:hypothetical protein